MMMHESHSESVRVTGREGERGRGREREKGRVKAVESE